MNNKNVNNKFVIGVFFTNGTPYEEIAKKYILASCERFKLKWIVRETFPNHGKWKRNVAEKPKVILDMLNTKISSDECLVFLDADSEIVQYPQLFHSIALEYDIALHYLDWNSWYGYSNNPSVKELLSGTLFLRNNDKVKKLCEEWYKEAIKSNEWEQKALSKILPKHDIKVYELPLSYCYLKTRPQGQEPLIKMDPFILHYQASRKYKRGLR